MFKKKLEFTKILFVFFSITLVIFVSTNFLNFNGRAKNYFFKTIILIDQFIFKEFEIESTNDRLVFLVVGHTYNVGTIDKKTGKETHPTVLRFIKKKHKKQNIDYTLYLGDLVQKASVNSILKVDKEISSLNKRFIKVIGNHDVHPLSYLMKFIKGQSNT